MSNRKSGELRSARMSKRYSINVNQNVKEFSRKWGGGLGPISSGTSSSSKIARRRSMSHYTAPPSVSLKGVGHSSHSQLQHDLRNDPHPIKITAPYPAQTSASTNHNPAPRLSDGNLKCLQAREQYSQMQQGMQHLQLDPQRQRSHSVGRMNQIGSAMLGPPVMAPVMPPSPGPNLHPALQQPVVRNTSFKRLVQHTEPEGQQEFVYYDMTQPRLF